MIKQKSQHFPRQRQEEVKKRSYSTRNSLTCNKIIISRNSSTMIISSMFRICQRLQVQAPLQLTPHLSNPWRQHSSSHSNIFRHLFNNIIRKINNWRQVNIINSLSKVKQ